MGCGASLAAHATLSDSMLQQHSTTKGHARRKPPHVGDEVLARSAELKAAAIAVAEQLLAANEGKSMRDTYVRATLTSYGGSCRVFTAFNKHTNAKVAIKTIPKRVDDNGAQRDVLLQELAAIKLVDGHPHCVELVDVFEDDKSFHLIMEYLAGGELFEHISQDGSLTEAQAATVLRSLMQFLAHCHGVGLAHLDIKPENIMFDNEGTAGVLKVIDFGSSEFVQPGQEVARAFGTVRYCSPEMANDSAGQKSDVWSAGIVMYHMLGGKPPFLKDSETETLACIQKGPTVKFHGKRWRDVSQAARDCIKAMLTPDPERRPTASEVLQHPWLAQCAPDTAISTTTLQQLQVFAGMSRARRLMLGVMARSLTGTEANSLLSQFLAFDSDYNGTLDFQELSEAAKQAAPGLTEPELRRIFDALDVDNTGTVDAREFFAAILHVPTEADKPALAVNVDSSKGRGPSPQGILRRRAGGLPLAPATQLNVVDRSFNALDREATGYITRQHFKDYLKASSPKAFQVASITDEMIMAAELDAEFDAMDANGDGVVSRQEFRAALTGIGSGKDADRAVSSPCPSPVPAR